MNLVIKILIILLLNLTIIKFTGNLWAQTPNERIVFSEAYNNFTTPFTPPLDSIYGEDGWEVYYFKSGSPDFDELTLDSNLCFLYIYDYNGYNMFEFLEEHLTSLENWVYSGGNLLLSSYFTFEEDTVVYFGFDSTYYISENDYCLDEFCIEIADSNHVVFSGPYLPVAEEFYIDGYTKINGSDLDTLLRVSTGEVCIAEKNWGEGKIIFAAGLNTLFNNKNNLGANILWYLSGCLHQQDDLGVIEVNSPIDKCHLANAEEINITIRNYGDLEKTNFNVSYQVNEGDIFSELFTDTIQGGFTGNYSFSALADLTAQQFNSIKTWTSDALDTVPKNDTLIYQVKSFTPFSSTGFPSIVCPDDSIISATPEFYPGIWAGAGIIDSVNGIFDPAIVGIGNTTDITYRYSIPVTYQLDSILFNPYIADEPNFLSLIGSDEEEKIPIGFPFQYFDQVYDSLWISINGFLSFDGYYTWGEYYSCFECDSSETETYFDNFIMVCMADLYQGPGSVSYETVGVAPNRKLIIDYTEVRFWYPASHYVTVQCILYEQTHQIEFQNTVIWGSDEFDYGNNIRQGFGNTGFEQLYFTHPGDWGYTYKLEETAWLYTPDICDSMIYQTIHVSESDATIFASTPLCGFDIDTLSTGISDMPTLWSTGDTTESILISEEGIYSIMIEGENCFFYDTIQIIFSDPVTFEITSTPTIVLSNTGTATVNILTGTIPYSFLWSDGQTTQTVENLSEGVYSVIVTDNNGCYDTDAVYVDTYTQLFENESDQISIYPNPASDFLFINTLLNNINTSINFYSLEGQLIKSGQINLNKIDISDLKSGFYLIEIFSENNLFINKLMIVN